MDLRIYNPAHELQGIVDTASSIIWTDRFRQAGDFEIYAPASAAVLALLQEDWLVECPGREMVGIIETIKLDTDEETGDYLTVTGRCLRSILDRRVIWPQTVLSGTVEAGLRKLVTDAYISPTLPARACSTLTLADVHGYTDKVNTQYTGTVLLEAIEELCAANDYGFKITVQADGTKILDFYKGTDRSYGQSDVPWVVFSPEYDNLLTSTYTRDKTAYKNVAIVAGEGEGTARRVATAGGYTTITGLDRRELFVDARDVSSNDGEISDTEYTAQLTARGAASMREAAIVESMEGTITEGRQYVYGVDYALGDTVSIVTKYGTTATAQVLEVVEVWDETGYTCTPTFG